MANRLLARFARQVFLSFPIPGREGGRYVLSGRPVPAGTGQADRAAARMRFAVGESEQCLLVFGGSLGARSLNQAAIDAFGAAAPCAVLHASGKRDYPNLRARLDALGSPPHYHLHEYIQPFAEALAAADLVAARAGGSVLEVAAAGLPAVLVPYPHATADHQTQNARWMERRGRRGGGTGPRARWASARSGGRRAARRPGAPAWHGRRGQSHLAPRRRRSDRPPDARGGGCATFTLKSD